MTRLDQEHDVRELTQELGLRGSPVEAVVQYCLERVEQCVREGDEINSISDLESRVAERLHLVFEEFSTDDELLQLIGKYTKQGELGFAALKALFDDDTYGTLMERTTVAGDAPDRYVAFIDCRPEKAARRFFTRWHEIAHLLTLTRQVTLPVHRSTDHPLERLMDEIAGRIGFYEPLFKPIFDSHHTRGPLTFQTVEAVRHEFSPAASVQATLFACMRMVRHPVIYLEAQMGYKAEEERRMNSPQGSLFKDTEPVPKLRVALAVPNAVAVDQHLRIVHRMRVPESSIVHGVFSDGAEMQGTATENLSAWHFSDGGNLGDWDVWIEAKRLPDRVAALVQPMDIQ